MHCHGPAADPVVPLGAFFATAFSVSCLIVDGTQKGKKCESGLLGDGGMRWVNVWGGDGGGMGVCMCGMRVWVYVCVRACLCVCVSVCVDDGDSERKQEQVGT
jgi:hypothetical protein